MPLLPTLGRTVGTGVKAARLLVRGSVRGGAWATRRVGTARARGAAGETGMIRLFDLHALSCAGDTLIAIGLAGTIFFNVPLGEARSKVALYLLITMVPFALLAPVVGPLLDHFRHGRRYALAVTMLGRAFLAYVISDHLFGWGLYPAAFGVLALSRAYGVARSAAVPRLLPEGVGLSQVGARASVYGTFAGAVVAPVGLLAFKFGPQWPLRVAMIIFIVGMVVSLRLPPRADSEPPEAVPRPWRAMLRLGRGEDRPLSGSLVISALIGSASLRLLYGFMLLFLAFVIMADQLDTTVLGTDIGRKGAVGLIGGALAVGTFLSTAVGTRLHIRRPLALQSAGLAVVALVGVLATAFYSLATVTLLALLVAIFSGIAKLAVDATIQERVPERLRASAFSHSETVLMIAWVLGGGIGIIPLPGRLGVALVALLAVIAAARAGYVATRLHNERLSGRAEEPSAEADPSPAHATVGSPRPSEATSRPGDPSAPGGSSRPSDPSASGGPSRRGGSSPDPDARWSARSAEPTDPWPEAPTVPARTRSNSAPPNRPASPPTRADPPTRVDRRRTEPPSKVDLGETKRSWFGRRKDKKPSSEAAPRGSEPAAAFPGGSGPQEAPEPDATPAPPGFHVYRPSSAEHPTSGGSTTDDSAR
ncbi:MFS transporter [Paractinoplanes brasiliensis]|uniref:Na+/melibiose symporter-like transporter n=1 Tax=Paractinoplanes brasiliensis TaxID=52695 RepID=A0A4R6JTM0_9ACTN|nr:MFS transporter [Actinoplanes brasiliensis]TDO39132.1 Na+/melibiose symporter-like transporter [Actinoplanes brasiliensis]